MKWIIRACLAVTTTACLVVMGLGTGGSFAVAAFLLVASVSVFVAMLEQVE